MDGYIQAETKHNKGKSMVLHLGGIDETVNDKYNTSYIFDSL